MTLLATWMMFNSKASAFLLTIALILALVCGGGWAWTNHQLTAARDDLVPIAEAKGRAEGQLTQLADQSDKRVADAKARTKAADSAAQHAYAQARNLLVAQPADPEDLCASASDLIRSELAKDTQ
jgi:hypothetical protein